LLDLVAEAERRPTLVANVWSVLIPVKKQIRPAPESSR
jgi:hypothetical protein